MAARNLRRRQLFLLAATSTASLHQRTAISIFCQRGGGEPHGYSECIASLDAIVIGRKTFEKVLALGLCPYVAKRCGIQHLYVDVGITIQC